MSLTCNKMSNFPCDSGRSFDSTRLVSVKSYENETPGSLLATDRSKAVVLV